MTRSAHGSEGALKHQRLAKLGFPKGFQLGKRSLKEREGGLR